MVSNGRETGNGLGGGEVQCEIRKCQDIFGSEFIALFTTNSLIGLTMEILPTILTREDRFECQRDRLTVQFYNLEGSLLFTEDDYLTGREIPDLNTEDKDMFEELLAKYAYTFLKVTQYKNYEDLIDQIFPDIEDARKERQKAGSAEQ